MKIKEKEEDKQESHVDTVILLLGLHAQHKRHFKGSGILKTGIH